MVVGFGGIAGPLFAGGASAVAVVVGRCSPSVVVLEMVRSKGTEGGDIASGGEDMAGTGGKGGEDSDLIEGVGFGGRGTGGLDEETERDEAGGITGEEVVVVDSFPPDGTMLFDDELLDRPVTGCCCC